VSASDHREYHSEQMSTPSPYWHFESTLPEFRWPPIPPAGADLVLAMLYQFEKTERLDADERSALTHRQLDVVLRHAYASCPWYRERWEGVYDPLVPSSPESFRRLPLLTRADLRERYADLASRLPPATHGRVVETTTSGSSGSPVKVKKTEMGGVFWRTHTLRDYAWHGRDLSARIAVIRHAIEKREAGNWGPATGGVLKTGPCAMLPSTVDIGEQLDWLQGQSPAYLLTYPSIAAELAIRSIRRGLRLPALREVATLSESISPDIRDVVRRAWGVGVVDMYSAEEVGYIALQCPSSEHYHVMSESVFVEVLDDKGVPCAPGEVGRVVVTSLDNFAMPLVRYDIGDFAEVGSPCPCGRTLPVLTKIAGRVRNAIVTRDEKRWFPMFGLRNQAETAKILQYQIVQTSFDRVEARLVLDSPLTPDEERRILERVHGRLPPGLDVSLVPVESIGRGPGGKFEEVRRVFEA
jgi:phenylacetate-CoA ligase